MRTLITIIAAGFVATLAWAHCDTLGGPVIIDAKVALAKGDVTPALKWVKPAAEKEIREAFQKTLAVRGNSPEATELADLYFFETLVRVHRAGEGAPYTGLKPAHEIEPPIAAADKALEAGKVDDLAADVSKAVAAGIRERFEKAVAAKKHAEHNVEAGREYVAAYVEFVHYVERLHNDASAKSAEHHHHE